MEDVIEETQKRKMLNLKEKLREVPIEATCDDVVGTKRCIAYVV